MRIAFFVGCCFLISTSASAQGIRTYSVEPGTKYVTSTSVMDEVTKYYIHFKNTTGKNINLSWKKLSLDLPAAWDYSLCDLGTCYAGIPEGEHTMYPVEKDSNGFLAPNIYPGGTDGTGKIMMLVWDKDNPLVSDTLTWIITAVTAQADVPVIHAPNKEFRLYPNPVNGRASILFASVSTGTLSIIDMKGVSQLQLTVNQAKTFDADLSQIASGEYIVLFLNRDGSVFHTKLVKN